MSLISIIYQPCLFFAVCFQSIDIIFAVQSSGSVTEFDDQVNFIVKTVKTFNISPEHTRVALISYANKAYLKFGFEDYTDSQSLLRGLYAIKSDHLNTSSRVSFIPAYKTTLIAFYEKRLQASQALVLLTYASNFTQNSQMENLVNNVKNQKISISVVVMDTKAELSNLAGLAGHEHNVHAGNMESVPWIADIICKGRSLHTTY